MKRFVIGAVCTAVAVFGTVPAGAESTVSGSNRPSSASSAPENRGIWDIRIRRMALHFDDVTYRESFHNDNDRLDAAKRIVDRFLAEHEINEMPETGKTALMEAAAAGQDDVVKVLLERGANPNLVSRENRRIQNILRHRDESKTALLLAAEFGKDVCVEHLLRAGADASAQDRSGQNAHAIARRFGHDRTARILQRHDETPTGR